MDFLTEIFNNREIATFTWLIVILVLALFQKKVRNLLPQLLKVFFSKKIMLLISLMFLYVSLMVYFFYKVGFWNISFLKDTILWIFGVAFILLFKANEKVDPFKKILLDNLKLVVLLEFIINLYSFSLGVELLIIPFLFCIIILNVFVGMKDEYKPIKRLSDNILSSMGLCLIIFAIVSTINNFKDFNAINNMHKFVFTPILTLGYSPFIYLIALIIFYEITFLRINYNTNRALMKYAKFKIIICCHFNLKKLKYFSTRAIRFENKENVNAVLTSIERIRGIKNK